jgi:uncharacterized protein (DUF885 family)
MPRTTFYASISVILSLSLTVAPAPAQPDIQLKQLFEDYHEEYLTMFPIEATAFGDSRYNDQLPIDIDQGFAAKETQFYKRTLTRLQAIDTAEASDINQLSSQVLAYELEMRLEGMKFNFDRIPFHQFDGLHLAFGQMGSGTGSQPFKTIKDYEDWLKRIDAFGVWMRVAIERFREGVRDEYVLPAILVQRMVKQMNDPSIVGTDLEKCIFFGPIQRFPKDFSSQDKERLKQAYSIAIQHTLQPAYQNMIRFLQDEYLPKARTTTGISALKGGREQYEYWVRRWTTTSLTPDAIYALGETEVARIRSEMELVKKEMEFDGSLIEFFDHLRQDPKYKPFKTPEEVISFFASIQNKLEPKLKLAFLNSPKTPFEIRQTEAFREATASAEYMPGTADGSRPGIFYTPIPDATQFNITSGMESLFLHEALPGHHYQISLQQENERLPKFARFLWYGAYGEGWALYCASIGKELGLYTDPKQRIGALGDEMHRAIRLVVDVGMHWKGWTREQAIEYMMANEPISEEGAIAEIERYMAYTAQALSYKVGQLKISEIRKKAETQRGSEFRLPVFHDQILKNGGMPLQLLEKRLELMNRK